MEIVLLYKFYIFSFLNLKEGGREGGKKREKGKKGGKEKRGNKGRKEGRKLGIKRELQCTATSRKMACTDSMKDATGLSEGHRTGFSISMGRRPLFPQ